jgi:CRP-like cAMP-binding protein
VQLGVGGPEGVVADTSLRTTRIRSNDGQMMIIANGDLLGRQLLNLDQPDRCLRIRRTVGVSYEVPPTKVKDALLGVLQQDVDVLQSPIAPEVFVKEYGDSAITYELRFWVADRRTMDPVIDRVMTRVWYALRERDLEIPFPIRTVHMVDMEKKAAAAAAVEKHANELERAVVRCPLFEERFLTSNERRELVRDSLECSLHPGEFAVRRGEMSDHMYLLLEGTVEVQPEGRAAITLQSPAWFGEIALLRGEPRTADVVGGAQGARVLRMSKMSVMPALQRNPQLAGEMSKVSNARREAAGVVDAPQQRTTLLRRLGGVLHGILIEMRPW